MGLDTKICIFNIQKFSLHDGPGIRTVVFFKGCPLRCYWCSNPESQLQEQQVSYDKKKCIGCGACVLACPQGCYNLVEGSLQVDYTNCIRCLECAHVCPTGAIVIEGETKTIAEIVEIVMQDEAFYKKSGGGATFSGGEVLFQVHEAAELAHELKKRGVHVAVETTGFASKKNFSILMNAVDLLLMDIKHWDDEKHKQGTGQSNQIIIENIKTAVQANKEILMRIPVIPGYNDSKEDALEFARLLTSLDIKSVELLPFHQFGEKKYERLQMEYPLKNVSSLKPEDLSEYRQILLNNGMETVLL